MAAGPVSFRQGLFVVLLATLAAAPQDASHSLALNATVERALSGGDAHTFAVALNAGDAAAVTLDHRALDVRLELLDADGQVIAEIDDEHRADGREHAVLVAETAGAHRLRVGARFPGTARGHYRATLEWVRTATAQDRARFEARRLARRAETLSSGGKPADAIEALSTAATTIEQLDPPDHPLLVQLLTRLADLYRVTGNRGAAEATFARAIALSDEVLASDDPRAAYPRTRFGAYCITIDDLARAEPLLEQAAAIVERTLGASSPRLVDSLNLLAAVSAMRGDFARALPRIERAVALTEQALGSTDVAYLSLLHNLADTHLQLKDYDRAEPLLQRALDGLAAALGPEHLRLTSPLGNLALVARERGEYGRATELLERAYGIRAKVLGEQHPQTASLLISIGNVEHARGDYQGAIDTYRRALEILESAAGPYHSLTLATLANLARSAAAVGDAAGAIAYQRRVEAITEKNIALNLAIGSERQKLAYFDVLSGRTARTVALHAQYAPADRKAAELAAEVIVQRKGRVLDALSGSLAALRQRLDPADQALLDRLRTTTARLASLALSGPGRRTPAEYRAQLDALEREREALEADISERSAAVRAVVHPLTLDAVKKALARDAVLVEFLAYQPFNPKASPEEMNTMPRRYAAYVIRAEGAPHHVDLGSQAEIDAQVREFREALRDPKRADVKALGRALDALVFEPLRPLIGDAPRVVLSPDGALNLVPFEALVDREGRFAVERQAISYVTSGRDLTRMQIPRVSRSAPLIVADPVFGDPAGADARGVRPAGTEPARRSATIADDLDDVYFAPLAGTAAEARAIQSLYPEATVLTRAKATKAALAAVEAPRLLHIATHGYFLTDGGGGRNPLLRAGVALAGANSGSTAARGVLTALEATTLNLWGTELVTLSACDTGVGEIRHGEGVYGLRRAFLLAGAETLVTSLWPVGDYVTRQMMTDFYRGLREGLGRGDALREAQRLMLARKGRHHPFYWASFIQAGDWRPLGAAR